MAISSFALLSLVALLGSVHCQNFGRGRDGREQRFSSVEAECQGKVMDVFFLLDSSTSIYINDYRRQHEFVREVVNRLDISEDLTRVGALTFSDDFTRPVLSLRESRTKNGVLSSITETNLPYRTGITNTHTAIRYVRENSEFRQGITKAMVIVTDGESRQQGSTEREAQLAREAGFYMFVIGVGQYRDEMEWQRIASDPDERFIHNVSEYRQLNTISRGLPRIMCPLPPIRVGACDVEQSVDLIFVAGPTDNNRALQVADYIGNNINDDRVGLQSSLLIDVCSDAIRMGLDQIYNFCNLANAGREFVSPDTATDLINQIDSLILDNRAARPNARQVILYMVDDQASDYLRYNGQTRDLRSLANRVGVEVVFIGFDVPSRDFANYDFEFQNAITAINLGPDRIEYQAPKMRQILDATCEAINERTRSLINTPN